MARIIGSVPLIKLGLPPLIVTTKYRLRYLEVLGEVRRSQLRASTHARR